MSHDYIPLLIKAVWPVTTLILAYWFRDEIRQLVRRRVQLSFPGGLGVMFGEGPSDDRDEREPRRPTPPPKPLTPSTVHWEKSASLFWLGNDLEWTSQTVLRGAPKERILHGLKQCEHHSSELGFGDTGPGRELRVLKSEVTGLSEERLDRKWRIDFSEKIYAVVRGFDGLVREHEPDFSPSP
jgi:hypothetical protein